MYSNCEPVANVKDVKVVIVLKALGPIVITADGIKTDVILVDANALLPIVVSCEPVANDNVVRALIAAKAKLPILVTDDGIITDTIAVV